MQTVITLPELRNARRALPAPVGLVPTMGFLHEGHLSLVRAARRDCAAVAVSIFVNPTQFGPGEDLGSYPRDLERDLELLRLEGVDLVWTPTEEVMYPPGYQTSVIVREASRPLEGAVRPGHFEGVATVVAKLFNAVQPERAYFGQKDAQQAVVIRRMVTDLNFPVEISVEPIVREPDGLAMSSRNTYLDARQRRAAVILYRCLNAAEGAYLAGERRAERLREIASETIASEPLARLQYVSLADPDHLEELHGPIEGPALLSMAVFVGRTRLIDNRILQPEKEKE